MKRFYRSGPSLSRYALNAHRLNNYASFRGGIRL